MVQNLVGQEKQVSHHGKGGEENSLLVTGKKSPEEGAPRNCHPLTFSLKHFCKHKFARLFRTPTIYHYFALKPFDIVNVANFDKSISLEIPSHVQRPMLFSVTANIESCALKTKKKKHFFGLYYVLSS